MIRAGLTYVGALGLAGLILCDVAMANAPDRSSRPLLRPGSAPVVTQARPSDTSAGLPVVVRVPDVLRPRLRPGSVIQPKRATETAAPAPSNSAQVAGSRAFSALAVARSPRPPFRPHGLDTRRRVSAAAGAMAATGTAPAAARQVSGKVGKICGSRAIQGHVTRSIQGKIRGCGVAKPVRVFEVSGVRLSTPALMDCTTAKALDSWVRKGVVPAVGRLGGGVAELRVVAHYACRTRNNKRGAKLSEHGKGRAVDIAGLTLKNGARMSVLKGWRDPVQGPILKAIHASACGPFGTVLGPNADRYHQDHLHLDTARYRSGSYCR